MVLHIKEASGVMKQLYADIFGKCRASRINLFWSC